ncbi:MAG: SIR2 family protein [Candidatus Omnitrophota bacterium]
MQKPVCVFIVGNGFSQGFGFPSSLELWDICLSARHPVPQYFNQCLKKYPISYFRNNNIRDIELLLSIWSAYIDNYQDLIPNFNNQNSGRGYYEAYLDNLCGHLLELGNKASRDKRYHDFKKWLSGKMSQFEIRFITLNYDLVLEKMISEIGKNVVYLGSVVDASGVFIRKLHGSANWLKANVPNMNMANDWKPHVIWKNGNSQEYVYSFNNYSSVPHIAFRSPPVIIPPLIQKNYKGIFAELVRLAKADLKIAKFVFVVGYSLPAADIFIRELLKDYSQSIPARGTKFVYINSNQDHCAEAKKSIGGSNRLICINEAWNTVIFDTLI